MNSKKYINLGRRTALVSFMIGTLIFGLYFVTSNSNLLFLGYGYVVCVGIINLIIFILVRSQSKKDPYHQKKVLQTCRIMLANIPILILYVWISLTLLNNMRITFTNKTGNKLTHINIIGCETEHIPELKPNESKTVWVGVKGDCSISMNYLNNGKQEKETVVGYVTPGMGKTHKHLIDRK